MQNIEKPLKVLISAYACRPGKGSEPGVGWHIVQQMARHHDVWVLTRAENRPMIEAAKPMNASRNIQFCYFHVPRWDNSWKWEGVASQIHYYMWQLGIYGPMKKLHKGVAFDVTHHVTYVRYWNPSMLAMLPVPFLWGPVGGADYTPKGFASQYSPSGKIFDHMRNYSHRLGEKDPLVRRTARTSSLSLATTSDTALRLKCIGATNVRLLGESALTKDEIGQLSNIRLDKNLPMRFISMGRLLHWKGFHLGLQAFAQSSLVNAEYWIIGDGPERKRLNKLADQLHVAARVKFFGNLSRTEALENLRACRVLVHPSLHDSGGWVCLEAMAAGRPIICLDHGGPATQVTPETGVKVPVLTPEQVITDLAEAMEMLANDIEKCAAMGQSGRERISAEFTWEHKADVINAYYKEICAR